jgi:hypothetical protein
MRYILLLKFSQQPYLKIEKASEMQQPSCKSKSFGQTGFLFSRFINVMCQVPIFWHCWFTRRFLNIIIINHFRQWLRSPPLRHIYLGSGWIDKLNAPRVEAWGHPHPLPEVFLRITHISETILSILTKLCPNVPWMILFQSYVRYVWGPKKGPRGGLKWLIIIIFKNLLVNQQCQKIGTWHITICLRGGDLNH